MVRLSDLDRCILFAKKGKWDQVDPVIPNLAGDRNVLLRAYVLLEDPDVNVRDLGASLFEKAEVIPKEIKEGLLGRLYGLIEHNPNGYDAFRAACALAHHNPFYHTKEVRARLEHFRRDAEVMDIAIKYLDKLNSKRKTL